MTRGRTDNESPAYPIRDVGMGRSITDGRRALEIGYDDGRRGFLYAKSRGLI
jgi:hypothetical protein